jgi:hypothetical protein
MFTGAHRQPPLGPPRIRTSQLDCDRVFVPDESSGTNGSASDLGRQYRIGIGQQPL